MVSHIPVKLTAVGSDDERDFLAWAQEYFRELDPDFQPRAVWENHFLTAILDDPDRTALWIVTSEKVGFVVLGTRRHHYDPNRRIGTIHEAYVRPSFRRSGLASAAVEAATRILREQGATSFELEVVVGNDAALAFWEALGFRKATVKLTRVDS